jgi:hypothetical protein
MAAEELPMLLEDIVLVMLQTMRFLHNVIPVYLTPQRNFIF